MREKINLHFILNSGKNASRVLKETKGMIDCGLCEKVIIVALDDEKIFKNSELQLDAYRKLIRLGSIKNVSKNIFAKRVLRVLSLFELATKYIILCKRYKPVFINAHGILLLPIAVMLKYISNCKLVYEAHELETEVDGLKGINKKYLKFTERLFIKYVDEVVVVSSRIEEWYRETYAINNIHVVRNFPYKQKEIQESSKDILRKEFDIGHDQLLFIYNGFLTSGRGIELTLEAFAQMKGQHHIIFMGYGPLVGLTKEYELKFTNIHYKNAVSTTEVIKFTKGADIGIMLIENTCLSYFYSLPNKLFEYIQAGIPAIISDFPEMGAVVDKYECGWRIEPSVKDLLNCVNKITKEEIKIKSSKISLAQADLCWENELLGFSKIYN